jgi:hypothetical protein
MADFRARHTRSPAGGLQNCNDSRAFRYRTIRAACAAGAPDER